MLALAHHVERQIEAGAIRDYATAARALGLTRARLTQVMNLLLLAPEIQERVLRGEVRATERALRAFVREPEWRRQENATRERHDKGYALKRSRPSRESPFRLARAREPGDSRAQHEAERIEYVLGCELARIRPSPDEPRPPEGESSPSHG